MSRTITWGEARNLKRWPKRGKGWKKKRRKTLHRIAKKFAGTNRKIPTKAELALRQALTEQGIMFDTQKVIYGGTTFRIADFYFPRGTETPLIVEVDGEYHKHIEKEDAEREEWLKKQCGAEIIRFTNDAVLGNTQTVVDEIKKHHVYMRS